MDSNEQNNLTNKTETEAWIHETDRQLSEGRVVGGWVKKDEGIRQKIYIIYVYIVGICGDFRMCSKVNNHQLKIDYYKNSLVYM